MRWDKDLDGQTYRIAASEESPLRVIAGPGTGKTYAMMRRVARLLQTGADPKGILMCTYTRTAAADLTKSLKQLGLPGADEVRSGTLHALCFGMLSKSQALTLTGRIPRILLNFEERFLIEDLQDATGEGFRDVSKRLKAFSAAWARQQDQQPGWPSDPKDIAFEERLLSWLRFHGGMLLDELVPEALRYLRENPAAEEHKMFGHILVDEYQDLLTAA